MNTKEAAAYLGLSPYYLRNLRHELHEHSGPDYTMKPREKHQRGGIVAIYTKEALDLWMSQHKGRKPLKKAA